MNRLVVPIATAALAIVSAGCGSNDNKDADAATSASKPAAPTQPSSLPSQLAGSYTRFVSKADIERTQSKRSEVGPNQSKPKPEQALLFFDPKAMTTRNPSADFVVQHDYSATEDGQIVIRGYQHPEAGSFCGPEIPQNATYTWKASADKLTLRAVKDPCADRDSTLTGTWTRK